MMNKIVVVDLDGCLCSVNTFRVWLLFSFIYLLVSLHWSSLLKFNKYIIRRVFQFSDRVRMKRDILSVTENIPHYYVTWFCGFLSLFTNKNVLFEMRKYQNMPVEVILCTAAPSCYVHNYAKKFNFDRVFATPSVFISDWKENIRERKLDSVQAYYGKNVDIDCVITDHDDDLPLLLKAERCLLVKPTRITEDRLRGLIEYEVL